MAAVRHILISPYHISFVSLSFFLILSWLPLSISIGDDEVLLEFKESLQNTKALDDTWIRGKSPCDKNRKWFGVQCNQNTVTGLRLYNLGLSGDIDVDALSNLQGLRMIAMANNRFSGPIPDLNKLGGLRSLFIQGNQFSGEISADYFSKMTSLKKIWLSNNSFSGKIPYSLGKLPNLIELHLEGNEFSSAIPPLAQESLINLDVSGNRLQGEIPSSMEKFGPKAFQGNPELCGPLVGRKCHGNFHEDGVGDAEPLPDNEPHSSGTKWLILTVVAALLLVTILFNKKQKEDNFKVLGKENLDEAVPVHIPSAAKREPGSTKGVNESIRTSRRDSLNGTSVGDFVVVNDERGMFGLSDLMKAAAEVLGDGGLGSAYKAMLSNRPTVVIKRLRETNKLNKDAFDIEIRKLGRLRHQNILPPLAYHYRKEEKLLVSEYVPKGSLLYLLHGDRGTSHNELNWSTRLKIIQGVARGMEFLHTEFASYEAPHGNLKSSNILLTSNYEPLLTDYAFHPLINNTQAVQSLFALKAPEGILCQQISPKSDVYCLGIIILEILTGKFPSQYLNNQKGGTDVVEWVGQAIAERRYSEVIDPEIASSADSLEQMVRLLHIGATCTESDLDKRLNMKEAIKRIQEIHD